MNYGVLVGVALVLLIPVSIRHIARQARLKSASEAAFNRIYVALAPKPTLEHSYRYGFPTFKVMFTSNAALEAAAAAGLNESFKQEIAVLCDDRGSKSRPFDVNKAVWFTYDGWLEEQVAKGKQVLKERGIDVDRR